jgi:S-methylmethionine-dependent homocysteine/selenocysteine methylase
MGSELTRRGADTRDAMWSARPMRERPDLVAEIHRDYARAGAVVHRTNTFRTRPRTVGGGDDWESLARAAVSCARCAVPVEHRVAGSVGPIEDCYRPDLAPPDDVARIEHEAIARVLAAAGVDLFVCETFASPREACIAVQACAKHGLPVWVSLTAGPNGDLLAPGELAGAARACVSAGASAVLVNCVAAEITLRWVEALASVGAPFGAYANASRWNEPPITPDAYAEYARTWTLAGATIVGACCGTGPEYVAKLAEVAT